MATVPGVCGRTTSRSLRTREAGVGGFDVVGGWTITRSPIRLLFGQSAGMAP